MKRPWSIYLLKHLTARAGPARAGRQVGGRSAAGRPLADAGPTGLGGAGGHRLARDGSLRPIQEERNPKAKRPFRPFPHWTAAEAHGLPTRVASGNPSPPSPVRFPQPLHPRPPPVPAGPAVPEPRPPRRVSRARGSRPAGRPPGRPARGEPAESWGRSLRGTGGDVAPGRPPPRPRRHSASAPAPSARPGRSRGRPAGATSSRARLRSLTAHGGHSPPAPPAAGGPSPVALHRPPRPTPSGERPSPRLLGAARAEPGLRPPRPRSPRPRDATGPPAVRRYLVVVVGVPLLQEGGGRRLVLLLELRADWRPPALRLLRRRGRRGLLLR